MTIAEITKRNYEANIKRGQISTKTQAYQMVNKLDEEVTELKMPLNQSVVNPLDIKELADVALVCFSIAYHFGYDLQKAMEEKTLYNEIRED